MLERVHQIKLAKNIELITGPKFKSVSGESQSWNDGSCLVLFQMFSSELGVVEVGGGGGTVQDPVMKYLAKRPRSKAKYWHLCTHLVIYLNFKNTKYWHMYTCPDI